MALSALPAHRLLLAGMLLFCSPAAPLFAELPTAPCPVVPATGQPVVNEEFRDPFYSFLLQVIERDSLGVWTRQDLQRYVERSGRRSRLPLEHFRSLERRLASEPERERRRGAVVERIWCVTLDENLKIPLPYSILGYRPGALHIGRVLRLSEWRLGDRTLHVPCDDGIARVPVTGLTVFRLDAGWVVLDVHGWLDNLLGAKLDDCWTQGWAICRCEDRMRGLTLSWNRDLRALNGEYDFYEDELMPIGLPFARGLDLFARPWIEPAPDSPQRYWQYEQ